MWDWLDYANFIPNIQEKIIEIRNPYDPQDNSAIRISEDGKKAILRQGSEKMLEFIVTETDKDFSFEVKTSRRRIDSIDHDLVSDAEEQLLILLTKLRQQVSPLIDTYKILYQDNRFKKALKSMNLKPLDRPEF